MSKSSSRARLTASVLERLNKPELRAVAADRGYKIGDGGKGTLIVRILEAQKDDGLLEDESLVDPEAVTEELDAFTKDTREELQGDQDGRQPSTQNPPSPVRENPLQAEPSSAPAPTSVPTSVQPAVSPVAPLHVPSSSPVPPQKAELVITPSTQPARPVELGKPMPVAPRVD